MNKEVLYLTTKLKMDTDRKKMTYLRNFEGKLLPFFTRNPERAKFREGFQGVLGVVARDSIGVRNDLEISFEGFQSTVADTINVEDGIDKKRLVSRVFDFHSVSNLRLPYTLLYLTQTDNASEKKGELEVGAFINQLFDLQECDGWKQFLKNKKPKNIIEQLVIESLPEMDEKQKDTRTFIFVDKDKFKKLAVTDLERLLQSRDFSMKYIDLFFAYYYFFYISQTIMKVGKKRSTSHTPLYFALDTEKVSGTRKAVTEGYKKLKEENRYLLVNNDLLDYLNALIGEEDYFMLSDIHDDQFTHKEKLSVNLKQFLERYKTVKEKEEDVEEELKGNIRLLNEWLLEDLSKETRSRFPLSLDEIGKVFFLRNRGRLGQVLNATEDLILLFTALIVGDEPILVSKAFEGFEERGLHFDRLTKEEIINMYQRMNILDKKSDSGDAQYVKPIL